MQTRPEVSCFQNRPPLEVVLRSPLSVAGELGGAGVGVGVEGRGKWYRGGVPSLSDSCFAH